MEKTADDHVNDHVQLLLQEAGLESVPFDPTSLEALKSLVASADYGMAYPGPSSSSVEGTTGSTSLLIPEESSTVKGHMHDKHPPPHASKNPPMSEVVEQPTHPELKRFTSELTSPSADSMATEDSLAAGAFPFVQVEGASPVENQILEQLHRQTRLLLEMQRRIDDLTATVEHLTRHGVAPVGGIPSRQTTIPTTTATATARVSPAAGVTWRPITPSSTSMKAPLPRAAVPQPAAPTTRVPPGTTPIPPHPSAAQPPQQQQQQQQALVGGGGGGLLMAIRNSPIFKIAYLFWTLRRRHVQELDGGLIFKILFMMAILTARMSSGSGKSKHGDPDWHHKFAGLVVLVFTGFLIQTGYMQYIYTFFVKENYPERIFNGEEVSDIIRNPNGGRNNNNNNNNNDDPNNPQNNNNNNNNDLNNNNNNPAPRPPGAAPVPRGHAPPGGAGGADGGAPDAARGGGVGGWRNTFLGGMIPQADQGGVAGALQDVALLFGSFLMSIFPMWQPEGPPQQPRPPPQPQGHAQQPGGGGGLAAGPGMVRPPRNAMQPADDSDDEDGN